MKRWAFHSAVLACLVVAGALPSGCRRAPPGNRQIENRQIVIGLAVPSLTHPFFIYLKKSVEEEAQKLGVKIVAADAGDVAAKQMSVVEDFITQRVDGVLMSPIGADALVPAVEALNQAKIPVATVDRKVSGGDVLVHVGADNVEGGRAAARYILDKLGGKGGVIELEGTPGASPAIDRKKGFDEVLAASKVRLLASQNADFDRAKGQSVMENLLQVEKDFQAVYAANDEMMLGALEAMDARGVPHDRVVTVGYDAIPDAIQCIREGRLTASIEQFPGEQGRTALRLLAAKIKDGQMPPNKEVYLKPIAVDKANLDKAEAEVSITARLLPTLKKCRVLIGFALVVAAVSLRKPEFLELDNLLNIVRQTSIPGIMAVGMTYVILTGGIDLSVGSTLALAGVVCASLEHAGWPLPLVVGAALLVGCAVGLANGLLITKGKVTPFVVTLGTMSIARGIAHIYTNAEPISRFGPEFRWIGRGEILGAIPVPIVLFLLTVLLGAAVLKRTRLGRYTYAIGGNAQAARLSGIKVHWHTTVAYVICGFTSALSAVVLTARLNAAESKAGMGDELDVIASVVVGGTSLSGGRGSVWGTLLGALLIGTINTAMNALKVSPHWQLVVKGGIIVGAVLVDRFWEE